MTSGNSDPILDDVVDNIANPVTDADATTTTPVGQQVLTRHLTVSVDRLALRAADPFLAKSSRLGGSSPLVIDIWVDSTGVVRQLSTPLERVTFRPSYQLLSASSERARTAGRPRPAATSGCADRGGGPMTGLLRFLRLAVVLAAGVGAWFGYEQYAAASDADDPIEVTDIAGASAAPWADLGILVADTTWDGPTVTSVQPPDDVVRQSMVFDPATGRFQMSLFDPAGIGSGQVEVDANEVFVKSPGGSWETPLPDAVLSEQFLRSAAAYGRPPTLVELVPEVVWPYTAILSDVAGGTAGSPTRVLTVRMKGGAFRAAEPALAAQWRDNVYYPGRPGRVELEVEIDGDGHVVAVRSMAPDDNTQLRFAPVAVPPTFEAPFVD